MSRGALRWSHRTLGLGLGLLLLLQALSGGALVFREELLVALNRQLLAVSQPTAAPALESILRSIDARFNEPAIERVVFPRQRRTAALVYLEGQGPAGRRVIASDPVSGAVLGEITGIGLLPFVLFRIHDELLLGDIGHALLLIEGAGLLYLVVAGFVMARPRLQSALLRVRWRGSKMQRRFDLHRAAGLLFAVFLAFSALTGMILQADFLAAGGGEGARVRAPGTNWSVLMPHVERIQRVYPRGSIEDVRISADGSTAKVLIHARDVVRPLAFDRLEVSLTTGEAPSVLRAAVDPLGRSLLGWMYPLHSGKALGWIGAVLAVVSALGLLCMPVLGWLLWRAKPISHRARARTSSMRNA